MSRYIDADTLRTKLIQYIGLTNGFNRAFSEAPSIDIVRCGECKHLMPDGRCREFADDAIRPSASDFCSHGERSEE